MAPPQEALRKVCALPGAGSRCAHSRVALLKRGGSLQEGTRQCSDLRAAQRTSPVSPAPATAAVVTAQREGGDPVGAIPGSAPRAPHGVWHVPLARDNSGIHAIAKE